MPEVATRIVETALSGLREVPRSGVRMRNAFGVILYRKVVRVRRRWSYGIVYEIDRNAIVVHFIEPTWLRR
jgi:hypothetical protein